MDSFSVLRGVFWLSSVTQMLVLSIVGLLLSAFLRPVSHTACYEMNSWIADRLWGYIQWIFESLHGAQITISGDALPHRESALVIANHLSYSDFYMIQALAKRRGMLGRCRYFVKSELRYVPLLGWALVLIDMILVSRNWMRDRLELERIFGPIKKNKFPICTARKVILHKGLTDRVDHVRRRSTNKTPLEHVLYPRQRGFYTTLNQFRGTHVKAVYDFTIAYSKGSIFQLAPTPVETHSMARISPPWKLHIHVRRYEIDVLPSQETEVSKWLENRWIEKDAILDSMKVHWTKSNKLPVTKRLV